MRTANGRIDYGGDKTPPSPFFLRNQYLYKRDRLYLRSKIYRWKILVIFGLCAILANALLIFWVYSQRAPTVYVDGVLRSGDVYQRGIIQYKALTKRQNDDVMKLIKDNGRKKTIIKKNN